MVLVTVFVYNSVSNNDNLKQFHKLIAHISQSQVITILSLVGLLMLVNWGLEALKWRYITRTLSPMSVWEAIEAVFCGLTWAIFTPNRLGEYGGRVMFLPNRKRIHGLFVMAVGAFGQNVITNVLGLTALIWFAYTFHPIENIFLTAGLSIVAVGIMTLFLVFYFHIGWVVTLLNKIRFLKKYNRFFDIIGRYKFAELVRIMGFCLARFSVFSFQYYLIIHLLIPQLPAFSMMMMVFILFIVQSALPSLDLFDVGVRSMTASTFFIYITNEKIAIIAAVSAIWLINLIIPAILGSVFVLKLKFFDRVS